MARPSSASMATTQQESLKAMGSPTWHYQHGDCNLQSQEVVWVAFTQSLLIPRVSITISCFFPSSPHFSHSRKDAQRCALMGRAGRTKGMLMV